MTRKALFFLACFLLLFCVACEATDPSVGVANQSHGNIVMGGTTVTVIASSGGPTDTTSITTTPTTTTNSQPTSPPAQPTTPPSTGNHQCNSGGCANPWGYVWQLTGYEQGNYVYTAPSGFCSWFPCIANFPNGRGYIMECADGDFSKSGGISGSCSGHGGNLGPIYQLISNPTPTATPRPSPTPKPTASPTINPTAVWTPHPTPNPTALPPSPTP